MDTHMYDEFTSHAIEQLKAENRENEEELWDQKKQSLLDDDTQKQSMADARRLAKHFHTAAQAHEDIAKVNKNLALKEQLRLEEQKKSEEKLRKSEEKAKAAEMRRMQALFQKSKKSEYHNHSAAVAERKKQEDAEDMERRIALLEKEARRFCPLHHEETEGDSSPPPRVPRKPKVKKSVDEDENAIEDMPDGPWKEECRRIAKARQSRQDLLAATQEAARNAVDHAVQVKMRKELMNLKHAELLEKKKEELRLDEIAHHERRIPILLAKIEKAKAASKRDCVNALPDDSSEENLKIWEEELRKITEAEKRREAAVQEKRNAAKKEYDRMERLQTRRKILEAEREEMREQTLERLNTIPTKEKRLEQYDQHVRGRRSSLKEGITPEDRRMMAVLQQAHTRSLSQTNERYKKKRPPSRDEHRDGSPTCKGLGEVEP